MTVDWLEAQTRRSLATLARTRRIAGWHAMRKDELVRVLAAPGKYNGNRAKTAKMRRGTASNGSGAGKPLHAADQLAAMAESPHWVQLRWTLSPQVVERARVALRSEWHGALRVIRVYELGSKDALTTGGTPVRDVEISGDVDHWYVPVEDPGCTLRFAIGYRAPGGRFFTMARSRALQMPRFGQRTADGERTCEQPTSDRRDGWASRGAAGRSGGLTLAAQLQDVQLRVDAELVLHGSARPGTHVTCLGRRVEVATDGTFLIRVPLPNGRQVIPAVATLPGGCEERTVVVAVERNTKELEPRNINDPWF